MEKTTPQKASIKIFIVIVKYHITIYMLNTVYQYLSISTEITILTTWNTQCWWQFCCWQCVPLVSHLCIDSTAIASLNIGIENGFECLTHSLITKRPLNNARKPSGLSALLGAVELFLLNMIPDFFSLLIVKF